MQVLTWPRQHSSPDGIADSTSTEKVQLLNYKGQGDTPWRLVRSTSVDTPAGGYPAMLQTLMCKQWLAMNRNKTCRRSKTEAQETSIIRLKREEGSFVYLPFRRGQGLTTSVMYGHHLICLALTSLNNPFNNKVRWSYIVVCLPSTPEWWRDPEQAGRRAAK